MIEIALGIVVLIAGVILAALFLAILGAYAACAGALIVQAFVDLLPQPQRRDTTP